MNSGIYNMDCMVAMKEFPDNFFELAIVDPPYGLGKVNFVSNQVRKIHKEKDWNNNIPTEEYFKELHRISKHQIIWGCNYYAKYIPAVGRIIHDKLIPKHGLQTFSYCDLASNSKEKRIVKYTYEWRGNVQGGKINWDNSGTDARIHPTQKPIKLYEWLLMNYAQCKQCRNEWPFGCEICKGKKPKILDTHMGSGSSVIACNRLGFDVWGYEIDKDYFEAAKKRIALEKTKLQLF